MVKIKSPGPRYALPTLTGCKDHDPTRTQAPAFSFGVVTYRNKVKPKAPGPKYNVSSVNEHGKLESQQKSISGRYKPPKLNRTPGPKSYDPAVIEPKAPSYSLGIKRQDIRKLKGPGPNKYALPTCIGPNVPDIKAEPAYSINSRHVLQSKHRAPGPKYMLPAPSAYLKAAPRTLILGRKTTKYGTSVPGPNKYLPIPTYLKPKTLEGVSFGVLHSSAKHIVYFPEDKQEHDAFQVKNMGDIEGANMAWWLAGCVPFTIPWIFLKMYRIRQMKNKLHGKVVLITGASSGLGEALAHVFYKAGCRVILAARRESQLERVKKELLATRMERGIVSHPPVIMVVDLAKIDDIPTEVEKVLKIVGHVDILVNNAGVSYRGEVLTTNIQVDQQIMLVNYIGQVALIKALLPSMVLRKTGHIVAISSIQGRIAIPYRSAYTASKHALQAFCDTLRAEVAHHNVNVSVISPGYIRTNLSLNALTDTGEKYGVVDETTAQGYEPSSVAQSILYAVMTNQPELTICEVTPRVAILLRSLLPSVYFYLMKNRALRLRQESLPQAKKR